MYFQWQGVWPRNFQAKMVWCELPLSHKEHNELFDVVEAAWYPSHRENRWQRIYLHRVPEEIILNI